MAIVRLPEEHQQDCKTASAGHHSFGIRVYYEDTDAAGIVYYANYLKFAERARTEMLRDYGADHAMLQRTFGITFVVKRCTADYHRPGRLDDLLDIRTRIKRIGGASVELKQDVFLGATLLVSLDVRLALLDANLKPARLPDVLIAALKQQYES